MNNFKRLISVSLLAAGVSACGTTYQLPEIGDTQTVAASRMFAEAQQLPPRQPLSEAAAERRFNRVTARLVPVAQKYCEALTADRPSFNCEADVGIDRKMKSRNAYFTFKSGKPVVRVSMPLLQDSTSDDEVAFVLGHEYGHLIGRHYSKQKQQELAGALILGAIAAAASSGSTYYDADLVAESVELGFDVGTVAYSQSYELESDTIGTRITKAAGYDPVKGAQFFARPEPAKTESGQLSFWGTHPPDEKRVATVLATVEQIKSNVALQKVQ